jgi:hypothetical protein
VVTAVVGVDPVVKRVGNAIEVGKPKS